MMPVPGPMLTVRCKTQIVVDGIVRYMGEQLQLPQRQALGLVGQEECEQVADASRCLTWSLNAPGPIERSFQGSRECVAPGQAPGNQSQRQLAAWNTVEQLEPPRCQNRSAGFSRRR